jgi:hypothetical protein
MDGETPPGNGCNLQMRVLQLHPQRLGERGVLGEGGFQPSDVSLPEGHRPARAAARAGVEKRMSRCPFAVSSSWTFDANRLAPACC